MTLHAQARVETPRASHYIKTLCRHFSHKAAATFDNTRGDVQFAFGSAVLLAQDGALLLQVTAPDAETLARAKDVVGGHLERFAYVGEAISVQWTDQA
jgi:hypothetical protein